MMQTAFQYLQAIQGLLPHFTPTLSFCISVLAFVVAIKNYRRKAGLFIRGDYTRTNSADCDDSYISSITLENVKDRAVTIFSIYFRIGHNYYIKIEDFETSPLLLKGYETYHSKYGPIEFYVINGRKIELDALFQDDRAKQQIVLSTSDGKYAVPNRIPRWEPAYSFFSNYMTALIHPIRSTHRGEDIGGNIRYVVSIIDEEGAETVMRIHNDGHSNKRFTKFKLPTNALVNKESLTTFLHEQREAGKWSCKKFAVFDMQEHRDRRKEIFNYEETVRATRLSAFEFYILGRLFTLRSRRQMKRENAAREIADTNEIALEATSDSIQRNRERGFENHGED
jgi:hypothetical protein